jgi:hypothetical protein
MSGEVGRGIRPVLALIMCEPFTNKLDEPFFSEVESLSFDDERFRRLTPLFMRNADDSHHSNVWMIVDDAKYEDLSIGDPVQLKIVDIDGSADHERVFYRFVPA